MKIPKTELRIETMRGTGPGGQHRNKTDSACRITHIPTGVSAYADERSQKHSKRKAMSELVRKLRDQAKQERARQRKDRRDKAIQPARAIRTYDYSRGLVTDHRSGKSASIKDVLGKGKIELVQPEETTKP